MRPVNEKLRADLLEAGKREFMENGFRGASLKSKGQAILVLKDPFFPSPEVYVIEFGILCVKL